MTEKVGPGVDLRSRVALVAPDVRRTITLYKLCLAIHQQVPEVDRELNAAYEKYCSHEGLNQIVIHNWDPRAPIEDLKQRCESLGAGEVYSLGARWAELSKLERWTERRSNVELKADPLIQIGFLILHYRQVLESSATSEAVAWSDDRPERTFNFTEVFDFMQDALLKEKSAFGLPTLKGSAPVLPAFDPTQQTKAAYLDVCEKLIDDHIKATMKVHRAWGYETPPKMIIGAEQTIFTRTVWDIQSEGSYDDAADKASEHGADALDTKAISRAVSEAVSWLYGGVGTIPALYLDGDTVVNGRRLPKEATGHSEDE